MKEIIDQLLEGHFSYDKGALDFSSPRLELPLHKEEIREGSFTIYGPENKPTRGSVSSDEIRMHCLTENFSGSEEEIAYRFDSRGLEEGDVLQGNFRILSNQGEYYLPFVVTVEHCVISSSLGDIRNLFHFANLAKTNWDEAVRLFYAPDFRAVFIGNDKQFEGAYRGLSMIPGNEQNVEEFLLEIHKKQRIEYLADVKEVRMENPAAAGEYTVLLSRNGWGYTCLQIEPEGDFLSVEKNSATDDDFLGNSFYLHYFINTDRLHPGNNYGCIHITHAYGGIDIPVTIVRGPAAAREKRVRREKKALTFQLMKAYESFRTRRIGTRDWMEQTGGLVEQMTALDEKDPAVRLFQAQLLITGERYHEAKWLLDKIKLPLEQQQNREPALWCYYLYLLTLISREEDVIEGAAKQVERIYRQVSDDWRISWLLLYLSEEYGRSPSRKWLMLNEQFKRGCTSPVLYIEAWHLLVLNPSLLTRLEEIEIRLLHYIAEKELLTPELIVQVEYLTLKQKGYSEMLLHVLEQCYRFKPDDDALQAICTLLIKGEKVGERYYPWYEKGVESQLRITRLYEYYMLSLNPEADVDIPKIVLLYFTYQSSLNYEKNAFLYAYIYKRRELLPEVYESVLGQVEHFVMEQLHKKRINADLAYLYENVITQRMIDVETAETLAELIFTCRIDIPDERIRRVVLIYEKSLKEMTAPVSGGSAILPIYDDDFELLLEDGGGNRYCSGIPYRITKLMTPGRLAGLIRPYVVGRIGYDVYWCQNGNHCVTVTEENAGRYLALADAEPLREGYRQEIRRSLARFYYEKDHIRELDAFLEALVPERLPSPLRNEFFHYMVLRGLFSKAYHLLERYGTFGMDPKTVVRLCSRLLSREPVGQDRVMEEAAWYAFRKGKYDEKLLSYLVENTSGTSREMRDIWKAAEDFDLETYGLCEKILIQMLYTGSYVGERMDIFRTYLRKGAGIRVELAFLYQCAYDFFVKDKVTDAFVFEELSKLWRQGEDIHKVGKLALLRYYAEEATEADQHAKAAIRAFLKEMTRQNIFFPFYKKYAAYLPEMEPFMDKTMIEYRTHPDGRAMIHYLLEKDTDNGGEYRKEEMQNMYEGVCVKDFLLFFGENLQYYITEELDGQEQLTESGTISRSEMGRDQGEGRFNMLNDIMTGKTLQDYETAQELVEEYCRRRFLAGELFRIQ